MKAWMIRGGRKDEFVGVAKNHSVAILAFFSTTDLSSYTPDQIRPMVRSTYPNKSESVVTRFANEISRFRFEIGEGDLVVMPYNSGQSFLIGNVGRKEYWFSDRFQINANHFKAVNWLIELDREQLPVGLWEQLRDRLTVKRLNIENPRALLNAKPARETTDPNWDFEVIEGLPRRAERSLLSRSKRLIERFWADHQARNGGIGRCEVCNFEHLARGMFDVHHLRPVALGQGKPTKLSDLALLCPRCHRLAHIGMGSHPRSIEVLKGMV